MKHTFKLLCFGLLFIGNGLFAQEEEKKAKKSPVELMFEYYNEEFKPFNKKKWYVGMTFNVSDKKLKNSELLGLGQIIKGILFSYIYN